MVNFKGKRIWEPFPGPRRLLVKCLTNLGYDVCYEDNEDAFSDLSILNWQSCELIITNPPFSSIYKFFENSLKYNVPFIIVLPVQVFATKYYHQLFKGQDEHLSVTFTRQIPFINAQGKLTLPGFATCFLGYKVGRSKFVDA